MARKMRKVTLLGAFEIQSDVEPAARDGLILGSRREQKGFVLETSRENLEQILSLGTPRDGLPQRLTHALAPTLAELGYALKRVELVPLTTPVEVDEEGYGAYVQGYLIFMSERKRHRLAMTATEAIQLALVSGMPIMADAELLQLDVEQFISHIDEVNAQQTEETRRFRKFVDSITASDFTRFYEEGGHNEGDEPPASP